MYAVLSEGNRHGFVSAVHEISPAGPPKLRLLDRVRAALRTRHYSPRTEEAYVAWIRRYILFHGKRHPAEMGAPEITRFLSSLAVDRKVAGKYWLGGRPRCFDPRLDYSRHSRREITHPLACSDHASALLAGAKGNERALRAPK